MWNALFARIAFQRPSVEPRLPRVSRDPALLAACGLDPPPMQRKPAARVVTDPDTGLRRIAPAATEEPVRALLSTWGVSRLLANVIELEEKLGMVTKPLLVLQPQALAALPDFSRHLGYDRAENKTLPWKGCRIRPRIGTRDL